MADPDRGEPLADLANELRAMVVEMLCRTRAGHPGGSLSAAEIMAALFFSVMRIDPSRPEWDERDRFILSKGHAAPVYYAALTRRGFFPEEMLQTYDELDSLLQAHPDMRCPGVDMSAGSLGQGLSVGLGMALGLRLKAIDAEVFVVLGDGELQEGQVWEAAMAAPKFGLDNLVAIVDDNGIQLMGPTARHHARRCDRREVARVQLERPRCRRPRPCRARRRLRGGQARRGPTHGHPRAHGQGEGRLVHGGLLRVALGGGHGGCQRESPRRAVPTGGALMAEMVAMRDAYGQALVDLGRRKTSAWWQSMPTSRLPAR